MDYTAADPYPDTDAVMLALHRAHQNWPNATDLRRLGESKGYGIFPYNNLEQASEEIAHTHRADQARTRLGILSDRLRTLALADFCRLHMADANDLERASVTRAAEALFLEENLRTLEEFLDEVAAFGHVQALKRQEERHAGGKAGHIFAGILAALEVVVLLVLLRSCEHGFQTIAVAAIGFAYCNLMLAVDSVRLHQFELLFVSVLDTKLIRRLLHDSHITTADLEVDRSRHASQSKMGMIRFYILAAKLSVMSTVCIVALLYNALF